MSWVPLGLSARAIAGMGHDHPWDPSDLLRCIRYCEASGITTPALRRKMAGRSPQWDRLLPEWDSLVALLRQEMDSHTDGRAPLTHHEMRRVLAAGEKCPGCDGTARGDDCPKCKGTGRRTGGRCRADGCYRGAQLCPTCKGRGYLGGDRR